MVYHLKTDKCFWFFKKCIFFLSNRLSFVFMRIGLFCRICMVKIITDEKEIHMYDLHIFFFMFICPTSKDPFFITSKQSKYHISKKTKSFIKILFYIIKMPKVCIFFWLFILNLFLLSFKPNNKYFLHSTKHLSCIFIWLNLLKMLF